MATKKAASKRATSKAPKAAGAAASLKTMPEGGRDPKGGLTAEGRKYFNKKEGSHLRPGVQGPADTPEKMVRKGSFLRRHFANPRGPMKDEKGEPTRLALSAHAWGEPVPRTAADAKKLAAEGHHLLEEYHAIKDGTGTTSNTGGDVKARKPAGKKAASKKTAAGKGKPGGAAANKG